MHRFNLSAAVPLQSGNVTQLRRIWLRQRSARSARSRHSTVSTWYVKLILRRAAWK